MEKESKWYKSIQILYDVAKQYGDVPVKGNDDEMTRVYEAVKEKADESESKFVKGLLLAFVCEKRREWEGSVGA